jgi:hypothetical protein
MIGDHLSAAKRRHAGERLDCAAPVSYVRCNILQCTRGFHMFKRIADWIARFFAPTFELVGRLPPQALTRIASPF